jgi:hypothetical protein
MNTPGNPYQIRLEETIDCSTIDLFEDIVIIPQENGGTLLTGQFADQSALRGFMDHLWNLNFTVLYLERVDT